MKNIYKKARLRAAERDSSLRTCESTYEKLHITREKLLAIEQEDPRKKTATPSPEDVVEMASLYNAPELCDYYCSTQCCVRKGTVPLIYDDLGKISAGLMAALHFLEASNDKIHSILADCVISDDEKEDFDNILTILDSISYNVESLKLWTKRNAE